MRTLLSLGLLVSVLGNAVFSAEPDAAAVSRAKARGIEFLKKGQSSDGSWTSPDATGVSGLATFALLKSGVPVDDPAVAKGIENLVKKVQPDGRICSANSRIPAYETAIAIMTLQAADRMEQDAVILAAAEKFLRGVQLDESKEVDKTDPRYGGAGYSPAGGRPDLSNTTFFLEALQASGVKSDDPAVQRALIFVSRCQNLESEFNTAPSAAEVNDGGFFYSVSASGTGASPAGKTDQGGLRSYGSMTYAGFKSMLYAGVGEDDPRVKAALEWIWKNYSVTENPGMGSSGIYYYYYLFAKGLAASGEETIEDSTGRTHNWREELTAHLVSLQKDNGSWVNAKTDRWMEGDPNLVTAYVLIAFKYCEPAK